MIDNVLNIDNNKHCQFTYSTIPGRRGTVGNLRSLNSLKQSSLMTNQFSFKDRGILGLYENKSNNITKEELDRENYDENEQKALFIEPSKVSVAISSSLSNVN